MELILLLVYIVWSTYAGWKVISGRVEWLERNETVNRIVKALIALVLGQFIGAFYLIYLILKLMLHF